jgi:RNA polymerase sigma factor (sigma-70 family)
MQSEELFRKNTPLVYHVFNRHFANRFMANNYKEDLIQEGLIALWRACLFYKEETGLQFSTYAYPAIRWGIYKAYSTLVKHDSNRVDAETMENYVESLESLDKTDQTELLTVLELLQHESSKTKQVVQMTLQGYAQREIAQKLGTTQVQISRILKRFRTKAQSELNRRI